METFDVAIVGLGAVGSAAAYQLSMTGAKVMGIDKFSPPHAQGSSHGESRITRQALGEGSYYTPLALRANEIWKDLEQKSGQELYNSCGLLMIANDDNDFFTSTVEAANTYDIEHELLNSQQVNQRFPAINMLSNETAYYEPGGGFLRPEACIDVQLKLAQASGVEIRRNTEVTSIEELSDGVLIQCSSGQQIKAAKVILAQGPWISDFLPERLKPLFKTLYQTLYWFDFDDAHTADLRVGKMPAIMCDSQRIEGPDQYNFYGFPIAGNTGSGIKFAIHDIPPEVDPNLANKVKPVEGAAELLYKNVSKYVKYIKSTVVRSMNCVYTVTPDENFIIDYAPDSQRIIIASPCSGHGFKHSAATGEIVAQLALTGETTLDISHFALNRF